MMYACLTVRPKKIAVSYFDPTMLSLNRTVESLDGSVLGIDDDDPREASQTLLTKFGLDLADEIVDKASLVISSPRSRDDQVPPIGSVFAHEEGEEREGPLLLGNMQLDFGELLCEPRVPWSENRH